MNNFYLPKYSPNSSLSSKPIRAESPSIYSNPQITFCIPPPCTLLLPSSFTLVSRCLTKVRDKKGNINLNKHNIHYSLLDV